MTLFASQDQQLRIGGEHLAHGVLKFTAGIDLFLDFFDPLFGDALGVSFSVGHEDQRPSRMTRAFGTVTRGLPTTSVVEDQRTGEMVVGDGVLAEERKLTLTQARGKSAFGGYFHLVHILAQEKSKYKGFMGMRK
jgi:hypothetical protein